MVRVDQALLTKRRLGALPPSAPYPIFHPGKRTDRPTRWRGQSGGALALFAVQEDVVGGVEDAAQVAGVVVEEFGDREDVDGDADGVVLGAAGGDEDSGQLELFGHAPELALAVLGDQVAAIGPGGGGLLSVHANTPSALHARDVRGCREVRSRLQTVGVFP